MASLFLDVGSVEIRAARGANAEWTGRGLPLSCSGWCRGWSPRKRVQTAGNEAAPAIGPSPDGRDRDGESWSIVTRDRVKIGQDGKQMACRK